MPILLQSQDNLVLSVVLWNLMVANKSADAAALGSLIVICVAPVIVFARRLLTGRSA
jgi:ABC-type Fe3+ transport system permease subunit